MNCLSGACTLHTIVLAEIKVDEHRDDSGEDSNAIFFLSLVLYHVNVKPVSLNL